MNQGCGSAITDAPSQLPLPDASKVPSYVNLARCVSGYTPLTSYTSPARREYSPARRDFSPIGGGRSRRDFSPAPSHLPRELSGGGSGGSAGGQQQRREVSAASRLVESRLLENKENPGGRGGGGAITATGFRNTMYAGGGGPLSPHKYTAQGQPCEGDSPDGARPYLKLSMLDNLNNSAPHSRTSRRSPLHLPKSPSSPGSHGMPSVIDMNRLSTNGAENRSPAKNGGGTPYYATNGDILNRNAKGGSSSPDAVDSDIRRRVEQLEKASCKNLSYNINRASKSPKVDERNGSTKQYPIRNYSSVREEMTEKEIITLDSAEKGSPIPVMKLLNPEFRAMLGKTTKISPNKQFTADFVPTGLSPLTKGKNDGANNNEGKFVGTNGSKNINLKTILTAEGGVNGGTIGGESGPNKVVNINVIVNKNVNNVNNIIKRDLNYDVEMNDVTQDEDLNCRNNNVQRQRELMENNINSNLNSVTGESESNVMRIRNDLEKGSPFVNGEEKGIKDTLVKQINTPVSNVKENLEKSKLESLDRNKSNAASVNSKEISPMIPITQTSDTKDSHVAAVDTPKDSVHSKEDRPKEQNIGHELSESDDAFNGNLSEAENISDLKHGKADVKQKLCQAFIDNEQAFASALSDVPEKLTIVQTPVHNVLKVAPEIIDITNDTLSVEAEESNSTCGVPQGSTVAPIPKTKTDSNEQLIKTEETSQSAQDITDSISIATETPVKDGVYFKQLLNAQRSILAQFLSTFESILSDHEQSKTASEEFSCTDSVSTPSEHPCDTESPNGASANPTRKTSNVSTPSISPDLEGHILLTVGQCKLLLNKKFPFFEKNCDKSLAQSLRTQPPDETEELQILNEDLSGLWDTMCIQIDEVREKFERLVRLRDNDWAPLPDDHPDAAGGFNNSNGGKSRSAIPKINSLKATAGKRSSLGSDAKKSLVRPAGSKSTSALPQLKTAKTEERKKFLEEKRKAMLAERRKEMKKVNGGGEAASEEATEGGLVQFL